MAETIVNVADLKLDWLKTGSRFEVGLADVDAMLATRQLGATLHVVPAGKTAWPYHRHHGLDEIFFVVSGAGEYRVGDRRLPIKAGDLIGAPSGSEAHQIINSSAAELRYLAFANHNQADVIEYPDSGRIAVNVVDGHDAKGPTVFSVGGRLSPLEYWAGEDIGQEGDDNG